MRRPQSFVILPFSARSAFGPRFELILGPLLGALWAPRSLKTVLEFFLERPRASQEHFFSAPEPSKSAPRGFQEASKRPPGCQEGSKSSLRGSGIDFGAILESFGEPFWSQFGVI